VEDDHLDHRDLLEELHEDEGEDEHAADDDLDEEDDLDEDQDEGYVNEYYDNGAWYEG